MNNINKQNDWVDNYDLLQTFYSKKIKIFDKNNINNVIWLKLPTVKDFYDNDIFFTAIQIFKMPLYEIQKKFELWKIDSYFNFFILICFVMNGVSDFNNWNNCIISLLNFLFKEDNKLVFNYNDQNFGFSINGIFVDENLWNYIWYIIWRSFEEKEKNTKPKKFQSKTEELFFKKQQLAEEKIRSIKNSKNGQNVESDQLLKTFLTILYAFPQINFEFLFNCTYAEISWLYEYSMKVCNYEIESQALAAGHLSKKFKFFTEK